MSIFLIFLRINFGFLSLFFLELSPFLNNPRFWLLKFEIFPKKLKIWFFWISVHFLKFPDFDGQNLKFSPKNQKSKFFWIFNHFLDLCSFYVQFLSIFEIMNFCPIFLNFQHFFGFFRDFFFLKFFGMFFWYFWDFLGLRNAKNPMVLRTQFYWDSAFFL